MTVLGPFSSRGGKPLAEDGQGQEGYCGGGENSDVANAEQPKLSATVCDVRMCIRRLPVHTSRMQSGSTILRKPPPSFHRESVFARHSFEPRSPSSNEVPSVDCTSTSSDASQLHHVFPFVQSWFQLEDFDGFAQRTWPDASSSRDRLLIWAGLGALKRTGKDFQTTGGAQARQPRQQQTVFREQTRRRGPQTPPGTPGNPQTGNRWQPHPMHCIWLTRRHSNLMETLHFPAMNGNAMFLTGTTPHLPDPSQPTITPRAQ